MKPYFRAINLMIFALVVAGCNGNSSEKPVPGAWQIEQYRNMIAGKSVAIVANQTSMVGSAHLVDTLLSTGFNISIIFAPEHGSETWLMPATRSRTGRIFQAEFK